MSDVDRIRWRCRRGMLELDLVLTAFIDRHLADLGVEGRKTLGVLLERPDPELLDLVMGRSEEASVEERAVLELLRAVTLPRGRHSGDGRISIS